MNRLPATSYSAIYILVALSLLLCLPGVANAQVVSPFTVEDVRIDITAQNALTAREQAFEQAQSKAFKTMAERMLPAADMASFSLPPAGVISTLVKDYEVTKEKLSNVRYVGTYTFRFRENAVRTYFARHNVRYTDMTSQPVLVLPFLQKENGTILWSDHNPWLSAWSKSGGNDGLVPVTVPIGDLDDVKDIGDNEALTYNQQDLGRMVGRYNAKDAVVAIAQPGSSGLRIDLYKTDQGRPEFAHRIEVSGDGGYNGQNLYAAAVQKVKAALQSDWKSKTVIAPTVERRMLMVRIPFKNLQEWTNTYRALQDVTAIDELRLKSLTQKQARVDLVFQGSEERLKLALEHANLILHMPQGIPAAQYAYGSPVIYELYLNKFSPHYIQRF